MNPDRRPIILTRSAVFVGMLALGGCGNGSWCKLHQIPAGQDSGSFRPLSHAAVISIDPDQHHVEIVDTLHYQGSFSHFELHSELQLESLEVGGRKYSLKKLQILPREDQERRIYQLCKRPAEGSFAVFRLSGELYQDPDNIVFGHEKVGKELNATVGPEGLWFSGSAAILPSTGDSGLPFRIRFELPMDWRVMTHGELTHSSATTSGWSMTWHNELSGHSPDMVGARYDVRREDHNGVSVETWFTQRDQALIGMHGEPVDDTAIRNTLHQMSNYYLDMYTELIGAYPFDRFSVVESFFPSGYGMPGWTLLGEHVIRMPYIPYTSLGHEILHNWWGNGVLVDNSEGNWCEGLTVYQADYRYKVLDSAAKGRAYRRDVLKSWLNYTRAGDDLPLSAFLNRHDGATRAVGYGKSMMIFVMLEDILSTEILELALRDVFQEFNNREASWSDIIAACEARGRVDLSTFKNQWLTRTGAPFLEVDNCDWQDGILRGELRQIQPGALDTPYEIDVSLHIECHDGTVVQPLIYMDSVRSVFEVECPEPRRLQVDPDARLFRQLHDGEIEAVISQMLAEKKPLLVAPAPMLADPDSRQALIEFGNGLYEIESIDLLAFKDYQPAMIEQRSVIFVSPPTIPEGLEVSNFQLSNSAWKFGQWHGERDKSNMVLAQKSAANPAHGALIFLPSNPDHLVFLSYKVPHYGKYSILDFDNRGVNRLKENASPRENPLDVRFGSW